MRGAADLVDTRRTDQDCSVGGTGADAIDDVSNSVLVADFDIVIAKGVFEVCAVECSNLCEHG